MRAATIAAALVFLFGVAVSVIGLAKVPAVHLAPRSDSSVRVDEVTRLSSVRMHRVVVPHSVEEIAQAVASSPGPISVGGARYSMGGQTATPDGLQLDLREFRGVVALDTGERTITVHSGTRWREVQDTIDKVGLAVKVMQTHNTFTVGGSLSVNAHGRYVGQGPLVRSVRSFTLVLANGRVVRVSSLENPELFYGAIGGYGALGVIADVTLDLATNTRVRRTDQTMPLAAYPDFFRRHVQVDSAVVFHNADVYPPAYQTVHVVSYTRTMLPVTVADRIQPSDQNSWLHRSVYGLITSGPFGQWSREQVIDPVIFRGHPITWRNYEASYDVSELEPASRLASTYVLQEYFVPVDSFAAWTPRMRHILQAHHVAAVNVSIRHALPDPGTMLAWAPTEVFTYVLYYRQNTDPDAQREVGRWTRELIQAAIECGGRYYLPYQPLATREQFRRAYPRATELFALKRRVDSTNKFTNTLWDLYEPDSHGNPPDVTANHMPAALPAEVSISLDSVRGYARSEGNELTTHPEWDLVYSSEAYARWLADGKPPSAFPYISSVGTFWRSYLATSQASRGRYSIGLGDQVMLGVIGISTAVEYGLKAIYEGTIGRLSELNKPPGGTAEDRYAAQVADAYAKLIALKGWYEFNYGAAIAHLWSDLPATGPGIFRKWERRAEMSAEYGIKGLYALVIGLGTNAAYAPDDLRRSMVVAGWSDSLAESRVPAEAALAGLRREAWLDRHYALLSVPRYAPYRDALLALARHAAQVRVAEISGSRLVTFTGEAPNGWRPPARTIVVAAYAVPTDSTHIRVVLAVDARDLLSVLSTVEAERRMEIDHIYDY